jgi:hypothetical protein
VISRTSVVAAADGSYAALLPAAAVSFKETVLTATVGAAGAAPVTARVTRADPDPAFASPNNTVPAD